MLLEPKEHTVTLQNGEARTFVLHKIPSTPARKIITQYPLTAIPKAGDYAATEALMLQLMSYVCVVASDGSRIQLTTAALVDNHTGDFETLMRLEYAMLDYNCSFLRAGKLLNYLGLAENKLTAKISQMLIALTQLSSTNTTPP